MFPRQFLNKLMTRLSHVCLALKTNKVKSSDRSVENVYVPVISQFIINANDHYHHLVSQQ